VRSRCLAGISACGKHSLEIFSLGTLLAIAGGVLFHRFGAGWEMQIAVNAAGFGAMLACARMLECKRNRRSVKTVVSGELRARTS
jgi:hypothetical protein